MTKIATMAFARNLMPGDKAPIFRGTALMPTGETRILSLNHVMFTGKYVLLTFYPTDWGLVDYTELISFSETKNEFHRLRTEVVFISCNTKYSHSAWACIPREEGGLGSLNFPMIADPTHANAKAFGVYKVDESVAHRATFLIDPHGTVRHLTCHELAHGRVVKDFLAIIAAIQYFDTTGRHTGANWTPKKAGIKVPLSKGWIQDHERMAVIRTIKEVDVGKSGTSKGGDDGSDDGDQKVAADEGSSVMMSSTTVKGVRLAL